MLSGWSLAIFGPVMVIYLHAWGWFLRRLSPTSTAGAATWWTPEFLTIVSLIATAFALASLVFGRTLPLPVGRKAYVRQLAAAAALSDFQVWCGIVVALAIWPPPGARPSSFGGFAAEVVLSAAIQVLNFGIVVWTTSYRSLATLLLTLPLFAVAALSPPWMAGALVVPGLLITWDAYRRWLVMDFD
jgi:hypothetical protein